MPSLKIARLLTFTIATFLGFPNAPAANSPQQESKPSEQQKNAPGSAAPKPQKESSIDHAASDNVQILSDTMGLNFGPYIKHMSGQIKEQWYKMMPESALAPIMKKGDVAIEFSILKDGRTAGLKVQKSSGDVALDRAAYAAIGSASPFDSLPTEFAGPYVRIRIKFYYNPEKGPTEPAQPK